MANAAYTGDTGDFKGYTVISQKTLNFFDVKVNSNKYYVVEVHSGNSGKYRVYIAYGRIGVTKNESEKVYDSLFAAEHEASSIISAKERKGYSESDLVQSNLGSEKAKELIDTDKVVIIKPQKTKDEDKKVSKLDKRVQAFVKQIYFEAGYKLNMLVRGNNSDNGSPLGKLSKSQINKGRAVLQNIASIITNENLSYANTMDKLISYCNDYYRYIPKSFGMKVTTSDILISTMQEVTLQNEILDFYESSLKMDDVIYDTENIDKQYEELHCDIVPLKKTDPEYKRIVEKVINTESNCHRVLLSVKNIFSVTQHNGVKFDDSCGNIQELFHGSRSANIPAILSTHLKLPNKLKGVQITGAMFGPGLYFANASTKSSQYSCSRFGGTTNKSDTAFMFLVDVALGKVKNENYSHYYYDAPNGYNSVKGCKGASLLNDEFIIYNEKQQRIRYIIEFATYSR